MLTGVIIMLTLRQLLIFQAIVDDFIETANPVGSNAISKKKNINVSSATIRNVMAELEDLGFLEKTHTSSGRVPSEKGYRYYVDHLITAPVENVKSNIIRDFLQDGVVEFEQIVQTSAQVLSDLTNYTSIILGPELSEAKVRQLEIVTLSPQMAVAILITNTGYVEHRTFSIPENMKASDIEKLANILNERLKDVPISQLTEKLNAELRIIINKYIQNMDLVFDYLKEILFYDQPIKVYIGGKSNILMQPEFHNVEKLYSFYSMMEREDELVQMLKAYEQELETGIKVTIGNENKVDAIKDFSLITTTYRLSDNQAGTIALIGPTRMRYDKGIHLLRNLSNEMTDALDIWYKHKG